MISITPLSSLRRLSQRFLKSAPLPHKSYKFNCHKSVMHSAKLDREALARVLWEKFGHERQFSSTTSAKALATSVEEVAANLEANITQLIKHLAGPARSNEGDDSAKAKKEISQSKTSMFQLRKILLENNFPIHLIEGKYRIYLDLYGKPPNEQIE